MLAMKPPHMKAAKISGFVLLKDTSAGGWGGGVCVCGKDQICDPLFINVNLQRMRLHTAHR